MAFGWFGYQPLEQAVLAWGARAIFQTRNEQYPLDILWDRQGHKFPDTEEGKAAYKQFADFINKEVLPDLQKLAHYFDSASSDKFCKHFPWPHDPSYVVVAQGSPNASYGYFYIAVSLVLLGVAPDEAKPPRQQAQEEYAQRQQEWAVEQERLNKLSKQQSKQNRINAKAKLKEFRTRWDNEPKRHGEHLESGDCVRVFVNQGLRDAVVIAAEGRTALIEYIMPNGGTKLGEIDIQTQDYLHSVNRNRLPAKWKEYKETVQA